MSEPELVHEPPVPLVDEAHTVGPNGPAHAAAPTADVAPPQAEPVADEYEPPHPEFMFTANHESPAPPLASPPLAPPLATFAQPAVSPLPAAENESLEERLRRLEAALAAATDTRQLEERVAARLAPKLERGLVPTAGVAETGKRWLPGVLDLLRFPGSGGQDGNGWLIFDVLAELRTIKHMYGDPRYRLSWSGRLIPPALLVLIGTSWIWLPGTLFMMHWMSVLYVKLVDLILAFFLFKVLGREAQRYRELVPQYPPPSYPPRP